MSAPSWEIREANQVLVGILHTEITTLAWSFGVRELIIPGRNDLRKFYPFLPIAGQPYDMARNNCCQRALDLGCSHVFFLDSDVVCPPDTILRLMAHNQPFISGVYHRRSPPIGVPVMLRDGQYIQNYPIPAVIPVDLVGAGCLLLRRDFLEKIPPQRPGSRWFDWRVNLLGWPGVDQARCKSEDYSLCEWAKEHGWQPMVDTSISCRHIGNSESRLKIENGVPVGPEYRPLETLV